MDRSQGMKRRLALKQSLRIIDQPRAPCGQRSSSESFFAPVRLFDFPDLLFEGDVLEIAGRRVADPVDLIVDPRSR